MKEEFVTKTVSYFNGEKRPRMLKTNDKRVRNLSLGRPFKKNPLTKIYEKIEFKINFADKLDAFLKIKSC